MLERRPAVSFLPTTAVLELTYRCSHRCLFCSCPWEDSSGIFRRRPELTTTQWKNTVTLLSRMGVTSIAFSGGDPLERLDLEEIISHAASCRTEHIETVENSLVSRPGKLKLYLLSNGNKVTDTILQMCVEYGMQLSISLPGLDTFPAQTGVKDNEGAYRVLRILGRARELGLKPVANIAVTRLNLYELGRITAAALLSGAERILLNRFLPGGRGLRFVRILELSPGELTRMLDVAEKALTAAGRFGTLGTEVPRCLINPSRYKRLRVSSRCAAGIYFFVVGPSGYIRVCNHSPVRLNHLDDIAGLKSNAYWMCFTQKRSLPEICSDCSQITECDGGCREAAHIVGGSPSAPDVMMNEPAFHIAENQKSSFRVGAQAS